MVLTGAAISREYTFKVYSISSYVQEKVAKVQRQRVGDTQMFPNSSALPSNSVDGDSLSESFRELDRNDPSCPGLRGRTG